MGILVQEHTSISPQYLQQVIRKLVKFTLFYTRRFKMSQYQIEKF